MPVAEVPPRVALAPTVPLLALDRISVRFSRPITAAHMLDWLRGKSAQLRPSPVVAVDNVSLEVGKAEIVGVVGESGCGKSTLGRVAVGLLAATEGGRRLDGNPIESLPRAQQRAARLGLQMIFQDPYASLNPRLRVQEIVGEAALVHGVVERAQLEDYVAELLRRVGLQPEMARRFPHQFSGGQRARIGIARALAVKPRFIVCDEAVAALDVSVQSQVLNLFQDLRDQLGLSYMFISHNLAVVNHIADRVAVMYLGRVVEIADAQTLFARPLHPYTQALLAETPTLVAKKKRFVSIKGDIPSPLAPPSGCHFHPRCPQAHDRCRTDVPQLQSRGDAHRAACHLLDR